MKPLKTCSHRALGGKEPKIVASPGSSSRPLKHALTGKPFCQTVYQNRSALPVELFVELKPKPIASLVKWSPGKQGLNYLGPSRAVSHVTRWHAKQQPCTKAKNADVSTSHAFESKKVINHKLSILIKIRLHYRVSRNKLLKTSPPHEYISIKSFNEHLSWVCI